MAKDAYYFSHDSNAQDDPKCMVLIDQLGMEGYGIFWALIERLRNEKDYTLPVTVISALSKRWCTSKEKVEAVVNNYKLFTVKDEHFFSPRLKHSMELKTERARLSASYKHNHANGVRSLTDCTAKGVLIKERKGNESKGNGMPY